MPLNPAQSPEQQQAERRSLLTQLRPPQSASAPAPAAPPAPTAPGTPPPAAGIAAQPPAGLASRLQPPAGLPPPAGAQPPGDGQFPQMHDEAGSGHIDMHGDHADSQSELERTAPGKPGDKKRLADRLAARDDDEPHRGEFRRAVQPTQIAGGN